MRNIISFILIFLWLSGCAHHHVDPESVLPSVTISISQPTENQLLSLGDTLFFRAGIKADTTVHGWGIALKRKGDDSLVYTWSNHYHASSYEVDKFWVNNLNQDTTLVFQLDVAMNHEGALVTKKVNVLLQKE